LHFFSFYGLMAQTKDRGAAIISSGATKLFHKQATAKGKAAEGQQVKAGPGRTENICATVA
jgi:hypothetical protein